MPSNVYLIKASARDGPEKLSQKAVRLFDAAKFKDRFKKGDFTAVKIHVGEQGNTTYIKAGCLKGLIDELVKLKTKPFITDTSTLYTGRRHNAIDHTILAAEHGFDTKTLGIPFIAPDGLLGTNETPVAINAPLNKQVFIASEIARCQSILSVAHVTGHIATCLGATLKTLGMGCASRKGKMRQHASVKPSVKKSKCTLCGQCAKFCPEHAITLDEIQAHINKDKCIGCAECVAVCRFDAVKYDFGAESEILQKNVAEHALGALKGKENRAAFFNFAISITNDCDCFSTPNMKNIVADIGILASTDPVALDQAALDALEQKAKKKLPDLRIGDKVTPNHQLEHAEKIRLGSRAYNLIRLD